MAVRDEAQGARSRGAEAYIKDTSRLRAPRNAAIRPHSHLVGAPLMEKMRCILYKAQQSQYDALRCFIDELYGAFTSFGYEAVIIDPLDKSSSDLFSETVNKGVDFIVSFNRQGFTGEIRGMPFYEYLKIPFISFMVDAPIHHYNNIAINDACVILTFVDKNHVSEVKTNFKTKPVFFLPHGGSIAKTPEKFENRPHDVIFCGSYEGNEYNNALDWLKQVNSSFITKTFHSMIDMMIQDDTVSYQTAWTSCTDASSGEYTDLLRHVDMAYRNLVRGHVLESLLFAGVTITCFGNGWENSTLSKHKNFMYKPAVNFWDAVEEIGKAKICLNISPMFKNGSHERVFTAMLSGAVCLTGENIYFKELFADGDDILFYRPNNLHGTPQRVIELLNNTDKLMSISGKAYNKALNGHTWKNRAEFIIKIVDAFRGRLKR